ncbi:MAG: hypothetical protein WCV41_02060 [Patescibacteria group bacterium]
MKKFKHPEQAEKAVLLIARSLPSKNNTNNEALKQQVLDFLSDEKDKKLLQRLLAASPKKYGTERKKEYWSIIFSCLTKEEALDSYLNQFPKEITWSQYFALKQYIIQVFSLSPEKISGSLERFSIRQKNNTVVQFAHPY